MEVIMIGPLARSVFPTVAMLTVIIYDNLIVDNNCLFSIDVSFE